MPPDRHHQRRSGDRIGDDPAGQSEDVENPLDGEHLGGRARGRDRPVGDHDQLVAVARGEVQIVQHHHHRDPARPVQIGQQVQHLDLVAHVQEGGGLIEQQQVGVLRERHRDPHPLSLPARELIHRTFREIGGPRGVQRLGDRGVVARIPSREDALVGVAAAPHQVRDRDPLGSDG